MSDKSDKIEAIRRLSETYGALNEEERKIVERFIATLETESTKDALLTTEIINYILRQLNNDSLSGFITFTDYQIMLLDAVKGLFKLIYLKYYENDLISRDSLFISSKNFLIFLFTRVLLGRDRELKKLEIESKRPVLVNR